MKLCLKAEIKTLHNNDFFSFYVKTRLVKEALTVSSKEGTYVQFQARACPLGIREF